MNYLSTSKEKLKEEITAKMLDLSEEDALKILTFIFNLEKAENLCTATSLPKNKTD
jgi:hypothetical protein